MKMQFVKPILLAVLALSLVAWVLDCSAKTTPDGAMDCCNTMPCSSHGDSQDCCKTMPSMHPAFVNPRPVQRVEMTPVVLAVLASSLEDSLLNPSAPVAIRQHHPPPDLSPPVPLPLLI